MLRRNAQANKDVGRFAIDIDDVIACGTSVGAVDMADGQTIVVEIPGIGSLSNRLV